MIVSLGPDISLAIIGVPADWASKDVRRNVSKREGETKTCADWNASISFSSLT